MNQVLIQVAASGINRADLLQIAGHYPPPPGEPDHPGLEVAGTIAALIALAAGPKTAKTWSCPVNFL